MRIHFLQHVPFESPATINTLAQQHGCTVSMSSLYANETLPDHSSYDLLVILGGPMNIYEDDTYPWLVFEKSFIKQAIACRKKILGICLGAQLLADCLGGNVTRNEHKEIGWFPVMLESPEDVPLLSGLPSEFTAFHWHGDTFSIPPGAKRIAMSEACRNQGFVFGDSIIALQFHIETDFFAIKSLLDNCSDDMTGGKFVHSTESILASGDLYYKQIFYILEQLFVNIIKS
jgi:GMP synthase-like glutamine amidotransferase